MIHDQCSLRPRYRGFFHGISEIIREQGKRVKRGKLAESLTNFLHLLSARLLPVIGYLYPPIFMCMWFVFFKNRCEGDISGSDSDCAETRIQSGDPILCDELAAQLVQR